MHKFFVDQVKSIWMIQNENCSMERDTASTHIHITLVPHIHVAMAIVHASMIHSAVIHLSGEGKTWRFQGLVMERDPVLHLCGSE